MSALRSAIEELAGETMGALDVDALADDLIEIENAVSLLESERARRIDVFAAKSGPQSHGYTSITAWLKHRCRMSGGRARGLVATARKIAHTPLVLKAWADLRLSTDQTRQLLTAAAQSPEEFADAEEVIVDATEGLTVSDTRRLVDYWSQAVSGPGASDLSSYRLAKRGLHLSRALDGMHRVDGWMTPEATEIFRIALDALTPPPRPGETRTPAQRRHDGLEDLARHYLDHADTPRVGREKPHLSVVADLDALRGVARGLHETEAGVVLTVDRIRQLACDSSISRIVLGPDSEVIDVGRMTRVIPTALARLVTLRDRHCTWKGCDRDARWCDIHHVVPWADGGETDRGNLRLLCRFHHTLIHESHTKPAWEPPPQVRSRK